MNLEEQKVWPFFEGNSSMPSKGNEDSLFSSTSSNPSSMLSVTQQHQQGLPLSMSSLAASQSQLSNFHSSNDVLVENSAAYSANTVASGEKSSAGNSNTPPSPADSGVLSDSKSEGGNAPNEQMFAGVEQHSNNFDSKLLSHHVSHAAASVQSNNNHAFSNASNNLFNVMDELELKQKHQQDNLLSDDIASIWANTKDDMPSASQLSKFYQHILNSQKLDQHDLGRSFNLPPGIHPDHNPMHNNFNNQLIQKSLLAQQQQGRNNGFGAAHLNRSTSFQPGPNPLSLNHFETNSLDMSSLERSLPGYNWNNDLIKNSLTNGFLNMSLQNSSNHHHQQQQQQQQQHQHQHQGSGFHHRPTIANNFASNPRLSRSISTPCNYGAPFGTGGNAGHFMGANNNNGGGLGSFDDANPFYKSSDPMHSGRSLSTMASEHTTNDRVDFQMFYEMVRAESLHQQQRRGSSGLAPWSSMMGGGDGVSNPLASMYMSDPYSSEYNNYNNLLNRFRFSRKVFVGGLPPDIDEEQIKQSFCKFGALTVDWPHKNESKSFFPPKGYAFLIFQEDLSVWNLVGHCSKDADKLFYRVSSPTVNDKQVQIRPWKISDADFSFGSSEMLDGRKTIFVGGVPRPLRAVELALIMERLYGGVCYAGIDVDQDLKYPKGAGRVAFNNQRSYIAAISARYVQLKEGEINKRVEVKPYVVDDQLCDECQGVHSSRKFAPYFCANVVCLKYYCETCWNKQHSVMGRELHKPLTKDGSSERAPKSVRGVSNW